MATTLTILTEKSVQRGGTITVALWTVKQLPDGDKATAFTPLTPQSGMLEA